MKRNVSIHFSCPYRWVGEKNEVVRLEYNCFNIENMNKKKNMCCAWLRRGGYPRLVEISNYAELVNLI